MQQALLGPTGHDSLQYHFIGEEGQVFTARIFQTPSLEVYWAWMYDTNGPRIVLDVAATPQQAAAGDIPLSADVEGFSLSTRDDGSGSISIAGSESFAVDFAVDHEVQGDASKAKGTGEDGYGFYQPDLRSTITCNGETISAKGFCKRYAVVPSYRYWAYRFFTGYLDDGTTTIWTADALFDLVKYDYFRVMERDGIVRASDETRSHHRSGLIRGRIEGREQSLEMTVVGTCDRHLTTAAMDSHLRQQAVRFVFDDGMARREGTAVYELMVGTVG